MAHSDFLRDSYLKLNGCGLNGTIPDAFYLMSPLVYVIAYRHSNPYSCESDAHHEQTALGTMLGKHASVTVTVRVCLRVLCCSAIYMSTNKLTGSIPQSISALVNLKFLFLDQNLLSGSLPTGMSKLVALNDLMLSSNFLSGTIPSTVFAGITATTAVQMQGNLFSGSVPATLTALTGLGYALDLT